MIHTASLIRSTIWNTSSVCPALAIAASLALTTVVTTGPAVAQEGRAETARDTGSNTFPTAESMKAGVAEDVERGKLTSDQGDMILRIHQRLLMGIDSGKLSVDEAMGIMEQRTQAIYTGDGVERSMSKADTELAELKAGIEARITAMKEDLAAMVAAGSITKEDAEARMAAAERQMWTRYRQAEMELKGDTPNKQMTRAEYDAAVKKMTEMVKTGEITREQMQQRLDRMKTMMAKEQTFTRKEYAEAAAKMEKMVEAGEITREQMQQRLDRMKTMMTAEKTITRQDYADAQARMEKMVESGEITREQMQQRLDRMKEMMRRDAEERSEQPSNDCMELRRKLGEAVRSGEMTREEAGEVWKEEGC
ncbi:MAG: hypothetical protein P8K80_06565 [Phycisphaerales bacterium]|nr:hypothetical protein [Phycisphaerales bacterium]